MTDWFLAPTLVQFRNEVNALYPQRDKTSDGTIGNASHSSSTSDHNPDARGCVCAIDIDEDLLGPTDAYPSFHSGTPGRPLVDRILSRARAGKLPQAWYLIYERKIYSNTYGWVARDYSGSNPHDHHFHLSVYHDPELADRTTPWGLAETSKPVSVTAEQIEIAKAAGMGNVDLIAQCCNETGCRFYIALAMLEKETGTCRNVYGNDEGGTFSGFKDKVSECNWRAFRHEVLAKGKRSNGVGPSQLTYKGFFTDMEEKGLKPWDMHDNIAYGLTLIMSYYRQGRDQGKTVNEALRYAGTKYNGSTAYGDSYLTVALKWKERVGWADYA